MARIEDVCTMTAEEILQELKEMGSEKEIAGMQRFGIQGAAFGIRIPQVRAYAKKLGKNHELAMQLWESGIREARIVAALVADPEKMSGEQMDAWAADFNSWEVCDQVCLNLFWKTPYAIEKIYQFSESEEEFVKRAGFALAATCAVHMKKLSDLEFEGMLNLIEAKSDDKRNFVKKAVNWALRQIGKRSAYLRGRAIATAERILQQDTPSARWIARDALRELDKQSGAN